MTSDAPSLGKFVLRTFLWLPPCFTAWYFSAPYHGALAGAVARLWVDTFKSGIVSALERSGFDLVFVTTLKVHPAPGQTALLLLEVNPLLYTYGLALLLALMLAARAKWWKILVGAALLLPFQSFGIAFDFLAQVVRLDPAVSAQAGLSGWRREAIAFGYQVGSLIFPSLVPVMLWALFCRAFIARVLGTTGPRRPDPPPNDPSLNTR
ncbi:MAG TPA: exosortase H-associated membrane protein [Usitatibacter sp.]|nr:exosortase H-associated membrane protein [Usitatibacter sp.]